MLSHFMRPYTCSTSSKDIKFKAQFHFLPDLKLTLWEYKIYVTAIWSVSGYQAVSGGNQQVDQSAWSVTIVLGAGRQVPHGPQV